MGNPCRDLTQPLALKRRWLLSALSLHKRMPWHNTMGLTPARNAYPSQQPHPCPGRDGALESLSPKPRGPFSKDNSAAVLGEGSAVAIWHRSCLPNQTPARKASPICSPVTQMSLPASLTGVFVVHKHLLTPICAPITQGRRDVMAFHSLLAHKMGEAVWVFILKTNTNKHSTRLTGIAVRVKRRCLPKEQLFIRAFTVHLV